MAVAVATTLVAPDYRIFPMINGGIPLWVLTMVYALVDFASITYGEPAIYISHIAGAGIGFMSKGLLAPGLVSLLAVALPLISAQWRKNTYAKSLLIAFLTSLPWPVSWP